LNIVFLFPVIYFSLQPPPPPPSLAVGSPISVLPQWDLARNHEHDLKGKEEGGGGEEGRGGEGRRGGEGGKDYKGNE